MSNLKKKATGILIGVLLLLFGNRKEVRGIF